MIMRDAFIRFLNTPLAFCSPQTARRFFVVGCICFTLAGAMAINLVQHRSGARLSSAGFGYGAVIDALDRTGSYRVEGLHYPGIAFSAHRLPAIPMTLIGLRSLAGDDLARIGYAKAVVFNALLALAFWIVVRNIAPLRLRHVLLLAVPFLMPFWVLTLFELSVEEAYIIPVLALLLALLWFSPSLPQGKCAPFYTAVLLAALLPWLKHSQPYWALAAAFLLGVRARSWLKTGIALVCVSLSLVGIALFTQHVSGRFTIHSSWEGWNLYKGNNPETLHTYPYYSLDTLDYRGVVVADRPLRDEWDHNDCFSQKARQYIYEKPGIFLENCLRKTWVFFFEIRRTGRSLGQAQNESPLLQTLRSGSLLVFRVCFWCAVWQAVGLLFHKKTTLAERMIPGSFFLLIILQAGFHIVGFAYERHIMPLVVPTVFILVWMTTQPTNRTTSVGGTGQPPLVTC